MTEKNLTNFKIQLFQSFLKLRIIICVPKIVRYINHTNRKMVNRTLIKKRFWQLVISCFWIILCYYLIVDTYPNIWTSIKFNTSLFRKQTLFQIRLIWCYCLVQHPSEDPTYRIRKRRFKIQKENWIWNALNNILSFFNISYQVLNFF